MIYFVVSAIRDVLLSFFGLIALVHLLAVIFPVQIERIRMRLARVYHCPKCGTPVRHMKLLADNQYE